jgi:RND family efflux transporter MFP subunit
MQKIKGMFGQIKNWSLRKKIFFGVIVLVVTLILIKVFSPTNNSANTVTDVVKKIDLKQTVLATGQVTSKTDLNLSFSSSGIVRGVRVEVGNVVKKGTILATLDQGNELASLTQARGALAGAQAKYQRTIDGASNEEITLAQIALDNAKRDYDRTKSGQDTLVHNAYSALLSTSLVAVPDNTSTDTVVGPTISGAYTGAEGSYHLTLNVGGSSSYFSISGLESGTGIITSASPAPLGTNGLFIQFPANFSAGANQNWTIAIPNKKSSYYVANYNAYQSALKTRDEVLGSAQAVIDQRTAELAIKKSTARQADLDLAQADILSAQGQYELASSNFEHTVLRAPADGTITRIDVKVGELAQSLKEVMVLQDVGNLYLESNVNEANITSIKNNASVDLTFDAFGVDKTFTGHIVKIDPSSTIISGVVNYKVTASIDMVPDLRPGMTANMTILVSEKDGVLVVPSRAIITDPTGTKTIRLVTDTKRKSYKEIPVTTGVEGDGGMIEVTGGITEGEEFVVLIKK